MIFYHFVFLFCYFCTVFFSVWSIPHSSYRTMVVVILSNVAYRILLRKQRIFPDESNCPSRTLGHWRLYSSDKKSAFTFHGFQIAVFQKNVVKRLDENRVVSSCLALNILLFRLSVSNLLVGTFFLYHKSGAIASQVWYKCLTVVKRSTHRSEAVKILLLYINYSWGRNEYIRSIRLLAGIRTIH